jgi:sugar (pentulose or hexulose) kinase
MGKELGKTYLAFDLGASSGRAILGTPVGDGRVELREVHRFANAPVAEGGGLFWDIAGLFGHIVQGMRMVAQMGVAPAGIGVDTWGVDFGLLDSAGELLERPRCYRDGRNAGVSAAVAGKIGAARLQDRTGSMHQDHASLCQLVAAKRYTPELLARARRLLFIPDLLRYWLCGDQRSDCTIASTSQMYDVAAGQWAGDILTELDLPGEILPAALTRPTVVGTLSAEIQRQTGLGPAPVVAGAGHDTGAALGICRGGSLPPADDLVVISSGTWSILGVFVPAHLPSETLDPRRFGYEANPDGSLRIVRNLTGAWLIERCRSAWEMQGHKLTHAELIAAARAAAGTANASAILDNQWEGFTHPPDMPAAIVEYCAQTGQPAPRTPGEFAGVIFASLAASYAAAIDELRAKTGRGLRNIYIVGGMSQNGYLNELVARQTGAKVLTGPVEATALGNVAVQRAAIERG